MGPGIKNIKYYNDDTDEPATEIWLNDVYQEHPNSAHN